jgi:hypothetical protein
MCSVWRVNYTVRHGLAMVDGEVADLAENSRSPS